MLSSMTSGLLATLAFVGVAGGQMSAPLNVSISTPSSGSLVGKNGLGWNVDFVLSSAAMNSSMALSVANGYLPGYSAPGSTTFKPGHSAFAPGLVVLCGTTVNSTAFPGGPNTNLAGLFQLNAITGTISTDVFSSFRYGWQVGAALFGLGVPSNLTIFVVNGTAPDIYSATNSSAIISNVAHVSFNISSNVTAPAVANSTMPAYTTSIIAPKKGDKAGRAGANWLVDILVNSNSSEAFTKNNATLPLFNAVNSSTFKPGPSAAVPGLVVLLNTTTNASAPFMGPMTNLAGLFQINAITGNRGPGSVNQVQLMWQVLKSITTPNATSLLSVYMVNGTAPLLVNATSAPELPGSRSDIAFTVAS